MSIHRKAVSLCLSGGAADGDFICGAAREIDETFDVRCVSGASVGCLVGNGIAYAIPWPRIESTFVEMLQSNRVLAPALLPMIHRFGFCSWRPIGDAIDKMIGKGTTLGESVIPFVTGATDLDTSAPLYLSSKTTPSVLAREAGCASSAFPGVAQVQTIESLGSRMSPDRRLFTDLGVTDNLPDHVFDDEVQPRIAVRLCVVGGASTGRIQDWSPISQALAIAKSITHAQSQPKSRRTDGLVITIDVPSDGGMDFAKKPADISARIMSGRIQARRQIKEWMGVK